MCVYLNYIETHESCECCYISRFQYERFSRFSGLEKWLVDDVAVTEVIFFESNHVGGVSCGMGLFVGGGGYSGIGYGGGWGEGC